METKYFRAFILPTWFSKLFYNYHGPFLLSERWEPSKKLCFLEPWSLSVLLEPMCRTDGGNPVRSLFWHQINHCPGSFWGISKKKGQKSFPKLGQLIHWFTIKIQLEDQNKRKTGRRRETKNKQGVNAEAKTWVNEKWKYNLIPNYYYGRDLSWVFEKHIRACNELAMI